VQSLLKLREDIFEIELDSDIDELLETVADFVEAIGKNK